MDQTPPIPIDQPLPPPQRSLLRAGAPERIKRALDTIDGSHEEKEIARRWMSEVLAAANQLDIILSLGDRAIAGSAASAHALIDLLDSGSAPEINPADIEQVADKTWQAHREGSLDLFHDPGAIEPSSL